MTHSQPMNPRDALAELALVKPGRTSLHEVFQHIVDLAAIAVPDVTEASLTLLDGTDARTPACTSGLALTLDEAQYELGQGPCMQAARATTIESISDMVTESRWPEWTARALRAGARSSLSIGLPMHDTVSGALNLYATEPHAFDDATIAVAQAFAGYAGLAMTNAYLESAKAAISDGMDAAMDSDAIIQQATGITMGDRHCSAEEALAFLTRTAHDTGRTLHDVSQTLVDRTTQE